MMDLVVGRGRRNVPWMRICVPCCSSSSARVLHVVVRTAKRILSPMVGAFAKSVPLGRAPPPPKIYYRPSSHDSDSIQPTLRANLLVLVSRIMRQNTCKLAHKVTSECQVLCKIEVGPTIY